MRLKSILVAAAVLVAVGSIVPFAGPAQAQGGAMNREAEILGFHQLCQKGDRRACVRFGIILGEMRERHAEWRRLHADWFWWER